MTRDEGLARRQELLQELGNKYVVMCNVNNKDAESCISFTIAHKIKFNDQPMRSFPLNVKESQVREYYGDSR